MQPSQRIVAVVCARGGSKGLPRKNLIDLGGVSLVGRAVAQAARRFSHVVISTDEPDIRDEAARHGATHYVRRPPELAGDDAPKIPAIRHAVREVETAEQISFEVVVDLDPTCPLRDDTDISGALALYDEHPGCDNVVSVTPSKKNPYFNQVERDETGAARLVRERTQTPLRRQDAPEVFDINGAVYVWRRAALDERDDVIRPGTRLYVMPPERSIDIDGSVDVLVARALLQEITP
jgi:CMP-N-acetylneuraminic acid synthetase